MSARGWAAVPIPGNDGRSTCTSRHESNYRHLLSLETLARIEARKKPFPVSHQPKAAEGGPVDSSLAEPVPAKEGE